jgi:hypothetical protein
VGLTDSAVLVLVLVLAVAATLLMRWRSGPTGMVPYIAAYFVFFGFGPAINYLRSAEIYSGIAVPRMGQAAAGLLVALLGMLAVLLLPVRRSSPGRSRLDGAARRYPLVTALLWAAALYAVAILATRGFSLLAGTKLDRIAAAGPGHYGYLLGEILVCSLYFVAVRTQAGRIAYWANIACYVCYCLATAERDFIFVLFSLALHVQVFRARPWSARLALMGVGGVVVATYLSGARTGAGAGVTEAFNQGSTMFVDTFVMEFVPHATPFQHGGTYLDALAGLVPVGSAAHHQTLMAWLVATHAPGSTSGYGFSLTAEAYLNFGMVGIFAVFAILTATHRHLVNRLDRHHFYPYASMLFCASWMYAFRGESATFLRTLAYGAALFVIVHLTSLSSSTTSTRSVCGRCERVATGCPSKGATGMEGCHVDRRDRPVEKRPQRDQAAVPPVPGRG